MPKFMNNKYVKSKFNLQLFAGEEGETNAGEDSGEGDDQDDDESDKDGKDEPKYTKADLDKAVARTIAKERRKAERAAEKSKENKGKSETEESEDVKARKKAEERASKAEAKNACYEAGVTKDSVDDVVALARAYMASDEDLDLEDAIEKVVKKYPQFKKGTADQEDKEDNKQKSWGQRQTGRGTKKLSGVEERFYEMNPDLRP